VDKPNLSLSLIKIGGILMAWLHIAELVIGCGITRMNMVKIGRNRITGKTRRKLANALANFLSTILIRVNSIGTSIMRSAMKSASKLVRKLGKDIGMMLSMPMVDISVLVVEKIIPSL